VTNADAIQEYCAPTSLADALRAIRGGDATILAGGTDLMPQTQAGRARFRRMLVNIRHIPELRGIARSNGAIRIGALTTVAEAMESDVVRADLPILAEAGDHFASAQLRNAATIGGNICNASPAGDTLVPLLVLDAEVELAAEVAEATSTRRMPLEKFFAGPGRTHRAPGELLVAVHVRVPNPGFVARFVKFGARPALDISAISIGVGGVLRDGMLSGVRVTFGAVAPTPLRGRATEAVLEGRPLSEETIATAAAAARAEVRPISDVRATAWYRRELVGNLMRRVLAAIREGS
jgi:CO/xanthine dehydrogenase FAD-binding subunit